MFNKNIGLVPRLLGDVHQKRMTGDFIPRLLYPWLPPAGRSTVLIKCCLFLVSCFLSPALWFLKANEEKVRFPKTVLFFSLLFGLI